MDIRHGFPITGVTSVILVIGVIQVIGKIERVYSMKSVQISEELFYMLLRFHLLDDDLWQEEIEEGLQQKLDAMINRNLYTRYKTAPTEAEQEQARQEYLDRKGYFPDFRW